MARFLRGSGRWWPANRPDECVSKIVRVEAAVRAIADESRFDPMFASALELDGRRLGATWDQTGPSFIASYDATMTMQKNSNN
ncbi:hypothetical protein D7S86_01855 [Pararobbsia silviterrae]|uniref:Uncharacterized protein n=2 Tax=Pararobbsia silviterrae TaxID=1792498 RepID=A0A494Y7M9_9BURK|nr:hypothetical protein D7S86_01855 [Pararobbsia silviterrae]